MLRSLFLRIGVFLVMVSFVVVGCDFMGPDEPDPDDGGDGPGEPTPNLTEMHMSPDGASSNAVSLYRG